MITALLTAVGSYLAGDLLTLALGRFVPFATAKVAGPSVMKGLKLLAKNYKKAPQRDKAEWDEYAKQHCSPDVWERLKNDN